jgi:hypothetical protein
MSSLFINGAKHAVSTVLGAKVPVTAISNAEPPVLSATTPAPEGSIVVLTSAWSGLNDKVARSDNVVASTSFEAEGLDTTDTVQFPAGEGDPAAYQIASSFVGLSQVRNVELSGGEQNFFQFQYVDDPSSQQRQKPTNKNAQVITFTLDYDPDLAWYDTLIELDQAREPVVLRETLPNNEVIYYYGYLSFNKVPTKTVNENMTVAATFSLLADPIRYPAPAGP